MDKALEIVKWVVEQNPTHRKGFKIKDCSSMQLQLQASLEHDEFGETIAQGKPCINEFADLMAIELHQMIVNRWSMLDVQKAIIHKLSIRFEWTKEQKDYLDAAMKALEATT